MKNGIKAIFAILCALVLILAIVCLQARGNVSALTKDVQALNSAVEEKDREIETLSAAAAESAREIEALRAEAEEKSAEIETLNADAAERKAELESLTADVAEKAAQLETLSADAEKQSAEMEALSADAAGKTAEIESLTADVAEKAAQLKAMAADAEKQSAELESLHAGIAEKDAQIEALSAQLAEQPGEEDLSAITEGRYANTKRYLLSLQEHGFSYSAGEIEDKDVVVFDLQNTSSSGADFSYTLRVTFDAENESAGFAVWNLLDYDAADTEAVRALCDRMNAEWRWVTFYTDPRDNSLNCSGDCALTDSPDAGEILWNTTVNIHTVLGLIYDDLLPFVR